MTTSWRAADGVLTCRAASTVAGTAVEPLTSRPRGATPSSPADPRQERADSSAMRAGSIAARRRRRRPSPASTDRARPARGVRPRHRRRDARQRPSRASPEHLDWAIPSRSFELLEADWKEERQDGIWSAGRPRGIGAREPSSLRPTWKSALFQSASATASCATPSSRATPPGSATVSRWSAPSRRVLSPPPTPRGSTVVRDVRWDRTEANRGEEQTMGRGWRDDRRGQRDQGTA